KVAQNENALGLASSGRSGSSPKLKKSISSSLGSSSAEGIINESPIQGDVSHMPEADNSLLNAMDALDLGVDQSRSRRGPPFGSDSTPEDRGRSGSKDSLPFGSSSSENREQPQQLAEQRDQVNSASASSSAGNNTSTSSSSTNNTSHNSSHTSSFSGA
ncbi:unnamed protein product, partial [Amoebophrya sp. A25]